LRKFLTIVVPLLLPTALYLVYLLAARRRAQTAGGKAGWWMEVPWAWLAVAGFVLMLISLAGYALFGGAEPGSEYRPARVIDGRIEPGGFEEK
jgi:hypothetical protein